MLRHRIEQGIVLALGFLLGAGLAICVTPGDYILCVLAGVALSLFCREHFLRSYGGELFWRSPHHHNRPHASGSV
jgi:hypothetical protein